MNTGGGGRWILPGAAMPLQKIETIDEPLSRASAEGTMELFAKKSRRLDDARNRLIWGDNLQVLASLLRQTTVRST